MGNGLYTMYKLMSLAAPAQVHEGEGEEEEIGGDQAKQNRKCNDRYITMKVIIPFSIWTIIFQVIPAVIGQLFDPDEWYFELNKSPAVPPTWVFGVVWPFLYFSLSTYGWYISHEIRCYPYRVLFIFFLLEMILNYMHTPILFGLENLVGPLVLNCLCLAILIYMMAFPYFYSKLWELPLLLVPYFGWTCYATYLSAYDVAYNWKLLGMSWVKLYGFKSPYSEIYSFDT